MLINVKMPAIVGILIITTYEKLKAEKSPLFSVF